MIDNFFFGKTDTRHYAILRVVFGILLFITLLSFYQGADFYYSSVGWPKLGKLILEIANPENIKLLLISMLVFSVMVTIGLFTKLALIFVIIGLTFIKHLNPFVWQGGDHFLNIVIVYLLFAPCDKFWSVDGVINKAKKQQTDGSVFMLRMIQTHICLIYVINGFTKSLDNNWLEGNSVLMAMLHPVYSRWDLSFIMQYPAILVFMRYYTILIVFWELLFPLFFLNKYTKYISFLIGISVHLGVILFLRHELFGHVMLASYLSFLSTDTIIRYNDRINQFSKQFFRRYKLHHS